MNNTTHCFKTTLPKFSAVLLTIETEKLSAAVNPQAPVSNWPLVWYGLIALGLGAVVWRLIVIMRNRYRQRQVRRLRSWLRTKLKTNKPLKSQEGAVNSPADAPSQVLPNLFDDNCAIASQACCCRILLVENNHALAQFYTDILSRQHQVTVFHEVADGVKWATENSLDLVVTNPGMTDQSGHHLAKMLRTNDITQHLPIVVLATANDEYSRVNAYQAGASDFIVIPVQPQELLLRVNGQLAHAKAMDQRLTALKEEPQPIQDALGEDKLVNSYIQFVRHNFADPGLKTEVIAQRLFVTKKQLERKVKQVMSLSPNQYLVNYRLEYSKSMLQQGLKIQEIYERCGFSSHAYFSKKFKEKYQCSPSQWLADKDEN